MLRTRAASKASRSSGRVIAERLAALATTRSAAAVLLFLRLLPLLLLLTTLRLLRRTGQRGCRGSLRRVRLVLVLVLVIVAVVVIPVEHRGRCRLRARCGSAARSDTGARSGRFAGGHPRLHPTRQQLHLRLALLQVGEQWRGDEDRGVRAGGKTDEQRERQVLQRAGTEHE